MKILQESKGPKHQNSFWYDGRIAESGRWALYATRELRVLFPDGQDLWDNAARREARRRRLNDLGLGHLDIRNNNWFVIFDRDDPLWSTAPFSSYGEAMKAFRQWIEAGHYRPQKVKSKDDEDGQDIETARKRLKEMQTNEADVIRGSALEGKLKEWAN